MTKRDEVVTEAWHLRQSRALLFASFFVGKSRLKTLQTRSAWVELDACKYPVELLSHIMRSGCLHMFIYYFRPFAIFARRWMRATIFFCTNIGLSLSCKCVPVKALQSLQIISHHVGTCGDTYRQPQLSYLYAWIHIPFVYRPTYRSGTNSSSHMQIIWNHSKVMLVDMALYPIPWFFTGMSYITLAKPPKSLAILVRHR